MSTKLTFAESDIMSISQRLVDAIKRFEGFDSQAYWDATGKVWTIGWGRTDGVRQNDITTRDREEAWLWDYLLRLQDKIRGLLRVDITELQEEALISFAFNVGLGALRASTLLTKLNGGDHPGAAREFDRWVHSGDVVLRGLVIRRAEERAWFEES